MVVLFIEFIKTKITNNEKLNIGKSTESIAFIQTKNMFNSFRCQCMNCQAKLGKFYVNHPLATTPSFYITFSGFGCDR